MGWSAVVHHLGRRAAELLTDARFTVWARFIGRLPERLPDAPDPPQSVPARAVRSQLLRHAVRMRYGPARWSRGPVGDEPGVSCR
jgi:hypothetical protein